MGTMSDLLKYQTPDFTVVDDGGACGLILWTLVINHFIMGHPKNFLIKICIKFIYIPYEMGDEMPLRMGCLPLIFGPFLAKILV